ncbi:unnamed protein product [Lactuca saligna]|uniref:NAC domain-containing protein n=1 Tax=Lactuca saligna TaxID=75948 RepID=A0AA35Z0T9_LACSI|nr:unnamed protein product [Lactuca saligna]
MSKLSMVEATLPPGFRFHPSDHELICDYLSIKVHLSDSSPTLDLLHEVDLNKCEPWDLPETACVGSKEWYFYSQRDRKYATGLRTNRATVSGYWKATGKDRCISAGKRRQVIGMRKTLVFYLGRAPKGNKTDWVMHEFRLHGPLALPLDQPSLKEDWVLCRVFCKNRETVGGKEISNKGRDDEASCCSSLPQLTDPYMMFTEQVPCFSTILNPQSHQIINHSDINNPSNDATTSTSTYIPPPRPSLMIPSSSPCFGEKKDMIKAILSRFNSVDNHNDSMLSFGEGISDQSFLSDAALPVTMWYP